VQAGDGSYCPGGPLAAEWPRWPRRVLALNQVAASGLTTTIAALDRRVDGGGLPESTSSGKHVHSSSKHATRSSRRAPDFPSLPLASCFAAGMTALSACAALIARERDGGLGQRIEIPLSDALLEGSGILTTRVEKQAPMWDGVFAPGLYRSRDDQVICFTARCGPCGRRLTSSGPPRPPRRLASPAAPGRRRSAG
jgi:hypothetical protein